MSQTHRLAPMDGLIKGLTYGVGPLPLWTALAGCFAPAPINVVLYGVAVFLVVIWASVWFYWRPSELVVDADGLTLRWPLRQKRIARADISGARRIDRDEFKAEFGRYMRVGAGGLWGAFGWLSTKKGGLVPTYISRMDGWVLVECRHDQPWLLSPQDPDRFVEALSQASVSASRSI